MLPALPLLVDTFTHIQGVEQALWFHIHMVGGTDIIILSLKMKKVQVGEIQELVQDYRISNCGVNGGDVDLLIPWG